MIAMRVRVLFFGQLKEITGVAQEDAELSDGARVEDLFERYGRRESGIFRLARAARERRRSRISSAG